MKHEKPSIYQNLSHNKRLEILQEVAYSVETESVKRDYDEDDMVTLRENLSDTMIELSTNKQKVAELTAPLKVQQKDLNTKIELLVVDIERQYSLNDETVYHIADYENKIMNVYDAQGGFLYDRELTPRETQYKANMSKAKGKKSETTVEFDEQ